MVDLGDTTDAGGGAHLARDKRRHGPTPALIALTVCVVLLALVSLVTVGYLVYTAYESKQRLYEYGPSEIGVVRAGPNPALFVDLCNLDDEPVATGLYYELVGAERISGSVRAFTATPGCTNYVITGLIAQTQAVGDACTGWRLQGSFISLKEQRPSLALDVPLCPATGLAPAPPPEPGS